MSDKAEKSNNDEKHLANSAKKSLSGKTESKRPEVDSDSSKERKSSQEKDTGKNLLPLSARKKQILGAIVSDYVQTAEPVGSKSLVEKFDLKISSATVRNEMAELESMGYLEHPHTSAGRVPTDKGYRTYVDMMVQPKELTLPEQQQIREYISERISEASQLIEKAAEVLVERTGMTSLCLTPDYAKTKIRQVRLMMLDRGRVLVLVILAPGIVNDKVIRVPDYLGESEIDLISKAVQTAFTGCDINEVSIVAMSLAEEISGISDIPVDLTEIIIKETLDSINDARKSEVCLKGSHKLLGHPEFADTKKARDYLDRISDKELVAGYLSNIAGTATQEHLPNEAFDPNSCYTVKIGSEIGLEGFEDCSFIVSVYGAGQELRGSLGVIGPKRMAYSRILSDVRFVNRIISDGLLRLSGHTDED